MYVCMYVILCCVLRGGINSALMTCLLFAYLLICYQVLGGSGCYIYRYDTGMCYRIYVVGARSLDLTAGHHAVAHAGGSGRCRRCCHFKVSYYL